MASRSFGTQTMGARGPSFRASSGGGGEGLLWWGRAVARGGGHMTLSGPVVSVPGGRIRADFPPADAAGSTWRGVVCTQAVAAAADTKPRESDRCNRKHGRDEKQNECDDV